MTIENSEPEKTQTPQGDMDPEAEKLYELGLITSGEARARSEPFSASGVTAVAHEVEFIPNTPDAARERSDTYKNGRTKVKGRRTPRRLMQADQEPGPWGTGS